MIYPMDIDTILRSAGGVRKVADRFGISVAAVYGWRQVPPIRVNELAEMAGMKPHEIRPDLYKKEQA